MRRLGLLLMKAKLGNLLLPGLVFDDGVILLSNVGPCGKSAALKNIIIKTSSLGKLLMGCVFQTVL